jgi:hypothetical protein
MPVLGIIASQMSGHLFAPSGAYDSIATTTLSSTATSVDFTSISSAYTHLQLRIYANDNATGTDYNNFQIRFNSDTGANYSFHTLRGFGDTNIYSDSGISQTASKIGFILANPAGAFTTEIVDILDYTNVNKYKTLRAIGGADVNAVNYSMAQVTSGAWFNTAAITGISIFSTGRTFAVNSRFALYGIKGA